MKKKSSTKKPLVNKADLGKINNAVDRAATTNKMYQNVFREKMGTLVNQISDMVTEEVSSDSESARRKHGKKITRTLNEMYRLFVKYEDSVSVMLSDTGEGLAVNTLLKFADKVEMIRLLHMPKLNCKSNANVITFKVYIARVQICWCRIRTNNYKHGVSVLTRFTN